MSLGLLPAFLSLAAGGGQDPAALVDAMIERSNALKSFVAEYQVHPSEAEPDDPEIKLRIVYRAPEELAIEFGPDDQRIRWVISSGRMSVLMPQEDGPPQLGVAEDSPSEAQACSRIAREFDERFPGLGDVVGPQDLGPFVILRTLPGTDSKRPSFSCQAGVGRGEGPLLGWLGLLKRSRSPLTLEGDELIWDAADGIRITLQKNTGFISQVEVTYRGETTVGLELKELSVDTEVEDDEFRPPASDPAAKDISESISSVFPLARLMTTRGLVHRRIREAVEADKLEWTSDARSRLGAVLGMVHAEMAPLLSAKTVQWARSTADSFCSWYQEAKKSVPEGDVARADELEDKRIEWETRLREDMEKAVEPYVARAVLDFGETSKSKISDELHALELEVAGAACRASVVEPALEYFAAQMERARNGELPPAKN